MPKPTVLSVTLALLLTATVSARPPIRLPKGWQPEGVTISRKTLYVGNLGTGAILTVNTQTRASKRLVPNFADRVALGLWVSANLLFVAGGPRPPGGAVGMFYVYNAKTGAEVAACAVPGTQFLNDVVVRAGVAYITDSFGRNLIVVPVASVDTCAFSTLRLPRALTGMNDTTFRANGIAFFRDTLLVADSAGPAVFAVDVETGSSAPVIPPGGVGAADGLTVRRCVLYVNENRLDKISVWRLRRRGGVVSAVKIGEITDPSFRTPTTSAVLGRRLYAANSRFADFMPGQDISMERFSVSVVNRFASRRQQRIERRARCS